MRDHETIDFQEHIVKLMIAWLCVRTLINMRAASTVRSLNLKKMRHLAELASKKGNLEAIQAMAKEINPNFFNLIKQSLMSDGTSSTLEKPEPSINTFSFKSESKLAKLSSDGHLITSLSFSHPAQLKYPAETLILLEHYYPEAFSNDRADDGSSLLKPGFHINEVWPTELFLTVISRELEGKSIDYAKSFMGEVILGLGYVWNLETFMKIIGNL
jgi:hypothetical protein